MSEEVSKSEIYEQGSKLCQQYSEQTMKLRTMALQIFIGYSGGILIILARAEEEPEYMEVLLISGGLVLILFGCVLGVLNHHYSTAHNAVRDNTLAPLEKIALKNETLTGTWTRHKSLRRHQIKWVPWYGPSIALGLIGMISFTIGIRLLFFNYYFCFVLYKVYFFNFLI